MMKKFTTNKQDENYCSKSSNTNGDVLTTRKLSFLPSFNHINNNDTNVNKNIDDDLLLRKKD